MFKIKRVYVLVPNVKKVVYSTCSIHREENEDVVNTILQKFPNFSLKKDILPTWHRRGLPLFEGGIKGILREVLIYVCSGRVC